MKVDKKEKHPLLQYKTENDEDEGEEEDQMLSSRKEVLAECFWAWGSDKENQQQIRHCFASAFSHGTSRFLQSLK